MNSLVKTKLFELINGIESTTERQYGGGLDDAYMNRRSAFAPPDVNSAFASPMSQGGLPTIYRESGGGADYAGAGEAYADMAAQEETSYNDDGLGGDYGGDDFGPINIYEAAPAAPPTSTPSDGDDESNYITDERYAELYGRSGDGKASFTDGTFDPDSGTFTGGEFIYGKPGGQEGPSQQDYIEKLNNEGFPEWSWPYYNSLKDRGMSNDAATAALAAAMSTPGGLSGMQDAYAGNYSYGGAFGTMQDLLEKGAMNQLGLDSIIKADAATKKEDRKLDLIDNPDLPEGVLNSVGLGGAFNSLKDIFSTQSEMSPRTLMAIENTLKDSGAEFTPVNQTMQAGMDYAMALIPGGNVLKGLSNLTGAGRTIGTITKNGLSFNLSDTGKFSLNEDSTFDAQDTTGSDNDSVSARRPRPVQQKTVSTTKDKPLTGMAALLARRSKPTSRLELDDKASGQDKFEKIYNRRYRNI